MKNKTEVRVISLADSKDRRKYMEAQLKPIFSDFKFFDACDGRVVDYRNLEGISVSYGHQLDSGQIATVVSHLRCIEEWYLGSSTNHLLVLEDDMDIGNTRKFEFSVDDLVMELPSDFDIIQLSLIKESNNFISEADMRLNKWKYYNWSAGSYILSRKYAKYLIDYYFSGSDIDLTLKGTNILPLIENVLFSISNNAYTLPLFYENTKFASTFYPTFIDTATKDHQSLSANFVKNWWGKNIKLSDILIDPLTTKTYAYINNTKDTKIIFDLGREYESIGQTSSAISFYLKAAEISTYDMFQYECLLRMSVCFTKQGSRTFSSLGCVQNAVALIPKRPEGYFLMTRYYEQEKISGSWFNMYMIATIGIEACSHSVAPLSTDVGYPGIYALYFQKGLAAWNIGRVNESKNIFKYILDSYDMNEQFKSATLNNIKNLN